MSKQLIDNILRLADKAAKLSIKGMYKEALRSIDKAEKTASGIQDNDIWYRIYFIKGGIIENLGRFHEAKEYFEIALEKSKIVLEKDPNSVENQINVSDTLNRIAGLLFRIGKSEDSRLRCQEILKICNHLQEKNPDEYKIRSRIASTFGNIGTLLTNMGMIDEGIERYNESLTVFKELLANDLSNPHLELDISVCLHNLGSALISKNRNEEAKQKYEESLKIKQKLLKKYPDNVNIQLKVIWCLNDLGSLLIDIGDLDEAKTKFEESLHMSNKLLKTDSKNPFFQSGLGNTLNNLGILLSKKGHFTEAKEKYKQALQIYLDPLQNMTLETKSKTVIQLIQLDLEYAETETNSYKKIIYLKDAYTTCRNQKTFFEKYGLNHERNLAMEAGLRAFVEYSLLIIKEENDSNKRIVEYERAIQAIEKIKKIENDSKIEELLHSAVCYLNGRKLINESLKSSGLDFELIKEAKEQFKNARDMYEKATLCYCIYTGLLELETIENFNELDSKINLIREVIQELSEKADSNVISVFEDILTLLENTDCNNRSEFLNKLNEKILKIDYYALRQIFGHTSEKLADYLKEPFGVNIEYSNWKIRIKLNDPESIKGILTIKAGNKVIFGEPLGKRSEITIPYKPCYQREVINFQASESNKTVVRPIEYFEIIENDIKACILEHDCSSNLVINNKYLNIAIVQLKYSIVKEDRVIKLITDNTCKVANELTLQKACENKKIYKKKIQLILEAIKNKVKIVVFPEFSIPFEYLPDIQKFADENLIMIVSGSHYVTEDLLDGYVDLFASEIGDKDLRKNICPVIIPSSKIVHTEKMFAAKLERELFSEEGMIPGEFNRILKVNDNLTIGILVCFEYLKNNLKERLIEACNVILVPQTNPEPKRFIDTAIDDINNPQHSGNKTYIMANGIFPFEEKLSGGSSGLISTLDKYSNNNQIKEIKSIEGVYEQFVLIASIDIGFNPARDTANAQVPIKTQYIPIVEEDEIYYKAEADLQKDIDAINRIIVDPKEQKQLIYEKEKSIKGSIQEFRNLLNEINTCNKENLKIALENNGELIKKYSSLMYEKNIKSLKNLKLDEIKNKCCIIFVPKV